MLNSAQHARSAASLLDDVIDRSALEQAREELGGRDRGAAHWTDSESKRALLRCETAVHHHAIPTHTTPSAQRVRARHELRSEPLAAAQRAPEPRFEHA